MQGMRGYGIGIGAVASLLVILLACGDAERETAPPGRAPDDGAPGIADDSIDLVFTRDESAVSVRRPAGDGGSTLRARLEALLAGPTTTERAAGIQSWFSPATALALRSAEVDARGHAVVDFDDLRVHIPNASTSAGSRLLLLELNGTVFADAQVQSVEYRLNGSCDAFGEWLQYGCDTIRRADAGL